MSIGHPRLGLLLAAAVAAAPYPAFAHVAQEDRRYWVTSATEPPDHARREYKALRARLKAEAKRKRRAAKRLKEQGR